ncbi:alpha-E domain-containing protein [uncultured Cohaesibacter sp.]|uniref:alpha-E domain-containing protein n=1 Tax=uncultured Cohaesibacter sp. TaxID=1002546 RepID=UPI00292EECB5|nr:alpha-E domain-containing protein [uncultured Cohaesibacter sp.]
MSMLLSRYAEALFWFARYIERSASLARILNVQASFWQDHSNQENWASILSLYADTDRFNEAHGTITAQKVAKFYITDRENPGSILSCLWAARENARLLRPLISVSMWSYINVSYNEMKRLSERDLDAARLSRTCESIARTCDAIMGVTEGTYYRDAGWRFYQLGLWIERADQTSRLLDVKVAQVASHNGLDQSDTIADAEFWKLLLHSFEAYHAFQRSKSGRMDPRKVANFLMFNQSFPRSLTHCIGEIQDMLNDLYMGFQLRHVASCYEQVEMLLYELEAASNDPHLHLRFHGFNDKVQNRLFAITNSLGKSFFGHETLSQDTEQTQTQSQSATE